MKTIIVASTNPVKIAGALKAFQAMFPEEVFEIVGVSVASEVNHQPMGNAETLQGAINRIENAIHEKPDADFWASFEAGIENTNEAMISFTWATVRSANGMTGKGRSGTFFLPNQITDLIRHGMELGDAVDRVFRKKNSKQENGAVGLLTGNTIDRTKLYIDAMILALIPFRNPELY